MIKMITTDWDYFFIKGGSSKAKQKQYKKLVALALTLRQNRGYRRRFQIRESESAGEVSL